MGERKFAGISGGKNDGNCWRYPLIDSQDVPWTPYTGQPSAQTFALVISGGLYLKDSQPAFDTHTGDLGTMLITWKLTLELQQLDNAASPMHNTMADVWQRRTSMSSFQSTA